jgi:hypothetical protein
MKAYNGKMENGYNKFRKGINDSHLFRKSANTLSQINSYALPVLTGASFVAPTLAPAFASIGTALRGSQNIANAFKNTKL